MIRIIRSWKVTWVGHLGRIGWEEGTVFRRTNLRERGHQEDLKRRLDYSNKINLKEIVLYVMELIHLSQDRETLWAVTKAVTKLSFLQNTSIFVFQSFTVFWMFYAFFWVIRRRLKLICQRFGTPCLFHLYRLIWRWNRQGVSKRWHICFRRRRITQKKA
jgi:hypothetical protein